MQITAEVSQISKTVQRDLTFILNVYSQSSIHFTQFLIVLAKKNVVNFTLSDFYPKRDCVTMHNYAGRCKCICSYNLVYNILIQLLPLQSSVFVVHFSNAFWHGNEAFLKVVLRMKLLLSLKSFTCHIVNAGLRKFVFIRVIIKIESVRGAHLSHPCCSCRAPVAFVSLVSLVSHSCCSCLALVL